MLPAVRRALFGGTFDPPHIAHLLAAEAAYRSLGVDVVTFLPAGSPWQKAGRRVTEPVHRWRMTLLSIEGVDYFDADDREVHRDGWTYTIDTVEELGADEELVLVLGADSAARIRTWHRADDLLQRVRVAVAPRPGTERRRVEEAVGERLEWLDMPELPVSGTLIRQMASTGRSVRFLVAHGVWEYLSQHPLYTEGTSPQRQ